MSLNTPILNQVQ